MMGLDARLKLARLYLCTDAREKQGDLAEFLAAAFAGGVDIVQIRQKNMSPEAELEALDVARKARAQSPMPTGVVFSAPSAPIPPALATAPASAAGVDPAMGASRIGSRNPKRSQKPAARPLAVILVMR